MAREPLSDFELAQLLVRTLGVGRVGRLMGFCTVWRLMGMRSLKDVDLWAADLRKKGGPSRATVYRALADLRRAHSEYAKAEGRPITEAPTLEALARRLAMPRDEEPSGLQLPLTEGSVA